MKLQIFGHDVYRRLQISHKTEKLDPSETAEKMWRSRRLALIKLLSKSGQYNDLGFGEGDFSIGEDWFARRVFHLVLLNWNILNMSCLKDLRVFLNLDNNEFA